MYKQKTSKYDSGAPALPPLRMMLMNKKEKADKPEMNVRAELEELIEKGHSISRIIEFLKSK